MENNDGNSEDISSQNESEARRFIRARGYLLPGDSRLFTSSSGPSRPTNGRYFLRNTRQIVSNNLQGQVLPMSVLLREQARMDAQFRGRQEETERWVRTHENQIHPQTSARQRVLRQMSIRTFASYSNQRETNERPVSQRNNHDAAAALIHAAASVIARARDGDTPAPPPQAERRRRRRHDTPVLRAALSRLDRTAAAAAAAAAAAGVPDNHELNGAQAPAAAPIREPLQEVEVSQQRVAAQLPVQPAANPNDAPQPPAVVPAAAAPEQPIQPRANVIPQAAVQAAVVPVANVLPRHRLNQRHFTNSGTFEERFFLHLCGFNPNDTQRNREILIIRDMNRVATNATLEKVLQFIFDHRLVKIPLNQCVEEKFTEILFSNNFFSSMPDEECARLKMRIMTEMVAEQMTQWIQGDHSLRKYFTPNYSFTIKPEDGQVPKQFSFIDVRNEVQEIATYQIACAENDVLVHTWFYFLHCDNICEAQRECYQRAKQLYDILNPSRHVRRNCEDVSFSEPNHDEYFATIKTSSL